jgi:hypothetical protein
LPGLAGERIWDPLFFVYFLTAMPQRLPFSSHARFFSKCHVQLLIGRVRRRRRCHSWIVGLPSNPTKLAHFSRNFFPARFVSLEETPFPGKRGIFYNENVWSTKSDIKDTKFSTPQPALPDSSWCVT